MTSPGETQDIALVILEQVDGRVVLQLRSDIEGIANPGKWGLFGGHINDGESPLQAALREVGEELGIQLRADNLRLVAEMEHPGLPGRYYYFHYRLGREMDQADLREGERYAAFWPSQIYVGVLEGRDLVDHHREQLRAYWEGD